MRTTCIFSFLFCWRYIILVPRSCDHFYIHDVYQVVSIHADVCFFHLSFHVFFLFFLYTHASYISMQFIISASHKNALMCFV